MLAVSEVWVLCQIACIAHGRVLSEGAEYRRCFSEENEDTWGIRKRASRNKVRCIHR